MNMLLKAAMITMLCISSVSTCDDVRPKPQPVTTKISVPQIVTTKSSVVTTKILVTTTVIAAPPTTTGTPPTYVNLLSVTNSKRALHAAGALTWSADIAATAALSANGQVCGQLAHNLTLLNYYNVGENLYLVSGYGARNLLSDPSPGVLAWYSEVSVYNFTQNTFQPSAGHFSQLVWLATTKTGCAMKDCGDSITLSCQYQARGNYYGQFTANVKPLQ